MSDSTFPTGSIRPTTGRMFVVDDGIMRVGDLVPDTVMLCAGVRADLYATADLAMTVTPDPEINVPVFQSQSMRENRTLGIASPR